MSRPVDPTEPPSGGGGGGSREPRLWGDFELHEVIGEGGMGVVYRARQPSMDRWVAIKMPRAGSRASAAERLRFQREASHLGKLDHENIVEVHDLREHEGIPYLVMALVEGVPLAEWLAAAPRALEDRLRVLSSACGAIEHAHDAFIVHRDLKPANVLVDARGDARILDFGISRDLHASGLTAHDEVVGTPAWLAPEQLSRPRDVVRQSDIHGLGLLLYFVLTGQEPRRGTPAEIERQVHDGVLDAPSRHVPVHPDLDAIVARATEREPEMRYRRAKDLGDDLTAFVEKRPVKARLTLLTGAALRSYVAWRLWKRHPGRVLAAGVFAAVVAAAIVLGAWAFTAERRARREAREAAQIAEYVVGFFEMSGEDSGGIPVGDAWKLLDHSYRGVQFMPGPKTELGARLLMTMGRAYMAAGIPERGSQLLRMAVTACEAEAGIPEERKAEALHLFGECQIDRINAVLARDQLEKALEIRSRLLGDDAEPTLETRLVLARLADVEGRRAAAVAEIDDVLRRLHGRSAPSPRLLASALEERALLDAPGDASHSVGRLRRALALRDQRFDATDPAQATVRLHLGRALLLEGRAAEADPFVREGLGMRRRVFGVHGPAVADAMLLLAETCIAEDRLVEAELHALDAEAIWSHMGGEEHLRTVEARRLLTQVRGAARERGIELVGASGS